jgi:hypothetical protein
LPRSPEERRRCRNPEDLHVETATGGDGNRYLQISPTFYKYDPNLDRDY